MKVEEFFRRYVEQVLDACSNQLGVLDTKSGILGIIPVPVAHNDA